MPTASNKVLTENLRELQEDGVLVRTDLSVTLSYEEYDHSKDLRSGMTAVRMSLAVVKQQRTTKVPKTKD